MKVSELPSAAWFSTEKDSGIFYQVQEFVLHIQPSGVVIYYASSWQDEEVAEVYPSVNFTPVKEGQ